MALPLHAHDAVTNWKRYGGDAPPPASYVGPTGSSASLAPEAPLAPPPPAAGVAPMPPQAAPPGQATPAVPVPSGAPTAPTGGYGGGAPMPMNPNSGNMPPSLASIQALGKQAEGEKPTDPGQYTGGAATRTYWGGSLIGGSKTGVEDYANWQNQHAAYGEAVKKWRTDYDEWQKQKAAYDAAHQPRQPGQKQEGGQPSYVPGQTSVWDKPSDATQQATPNPYAQPGQRSTPLPGTGPVQKPTKQVVNNKYAGVL